MIHIGYLALLLGAIGCLVLTDWRWHLAFFADGARSARVVISALLFFIVWDMAGIALHVFFVGHSSLLSGVRLAHEFPLEEVFFLFLLTYTTLLAHRMASR